ncbi:MAG: hypothetical protein V4850_32465 [Myxococcota bacterium]
MKRALKILGVLWAVGLVGWAVAAAQGWVGAEASKELTRSEDTGDRPLLRATKSDAGESVVVEKERRKKARLQRERREAEALQKLAEPAPTTEGAAPLLPATKSAAVPPRPEQDQPALLPSTKSSMLDGIGGLRPARGTQIGSGGLGARGSGLGETEPQTQDQQQEAKER